MTELTSLKALNHGPTTVVQIWSWTWSHLHWPPAIERSTHGYRRQAHPPHWDPEWVWSCHSNNGRAKDGTKGFSSSPHCLWEDFFVKQSGISQQRGQAEREASSRYKLWQVSLQRAGKESQLPSLHWQLSYGYIQKSCFLCYKHVTGEKRKKGRYNNLVVQFYAR